jgi:hypothetical protein
MADVDEAGLSLTYLLGLVGGQRGAEQPVMQLGVDGDPGAIGGKDVGVGVLYPADQAGELSWRPQLNVRGCRKVAGTAQRVLRSAWLFSTLIVLGGENRLQPVLRDVYDMLDQPFDECSVGSVGAEVAGHQAADLVDALV